MAEVLPFGVNKCKQPAHPDIRSVHLPQHMIDQLREQLSLMQGNMLIILYTYGLKPDNPGYYNGWLNKNSTIV